MLSHSAPRVTTRRRFSGQCCAGMALAPYAHLATQGVVYTTYSGFRIHGFTFCPPDHLDLEFHVRCALSHWVAHTLKGGPEAPSCTIAEATHRYMPSSGPFDLKFNTPKRGVGGNHVEMDPTNLKPAPTYPVEPISPKGGLVVEGTVKTERLEGSLLASKCAPPPGPLPAHRRRQAELPRYSAFRRQCPRRARHPAID